MTSRPTCIWIWSIWNDYFPYNTVCRIRCHELLFMGEIQITVIRSKHINNTHVNPFWFLTLFSASWCNDRMSYYVNGWGEKGKRPCLGDMGTATFSDTCASKSLWQFGKFRFYGYRAVSSASVVLHSSTEFRASMLKYSHWGCDS